MHRGTATKLHNNLDSKPYNFPSDRELEHAQGGPIRQKDLDVFYQEF